MNTVFSQVKAALGKPYEDLEFLLECLSEVLVENGQKELLAYLPWQGESALLCDDYRLMQDYLHLLSISFQLLNLVEVNGAVQGRRKQEDNDASQLNGLWAQQLARFKSRGISEEQLLSVLPDVLIEPVLTAHPTEAKRTVVLEEYRSLYLLIVQRENQMYTRIEQDNIRAEIKHSLTRLWYMGEIYLEKPQLESELDNILYYLEQVFPEVVLILDKRLDHAWQSAGYQTDLKEHSGFLPRLSFGNWVGGDRDGHPLVTPGMTAGTLARLRSGACRLLRRELEFLAKKLSIYQSTSAFSPEFEARFKSLIGADRSLTEPQIISFQHELFKGYTLLLSRKIPPNHLSRSSNPVEVVGHYRYSSELAEDLSLLERELKRQGMNYLAFNDLRRVQRLLQIFGFHLAHLDLRQNSRYHTKAFRQLVTASLGNDKAVKIFESPESVHHFILEELKSNRPFLNHHEVLVEESAHLINTLKLVARHVRKYGVDGLGKYIISMSAKIDDLLVVYLFLREAGLTHMEDGVLISRLPVVPLFETIDDLRNSVAIIDEYLAYPQVKASLKVQQKEVGQAVPFMDIMIGYSDSNKDGGILASSWFLHEAQEKLAAVADKYKTAVRFFHGTGGTISRGAGPVHWFVKTLPSGALNGQFRLTEQGETIERKYANRVNAAYNLELMLASVTAQTVFSRFASPEEDNINQILRHLGERGQYFYQQLIHDDCFMEFFAEATPIDVIERSKIGSRPSRRSGKRTLDDLRAIPWVFSWSQSRFNITGWFGVGAALNELKRNDPVQFMKLKKLSETDAFIRYVLTNIDTSLTATDERVMRLYASMVENEEVRDHMMNLIVGELQLSREMLDELLKRPMQERRKNHYYSTYLRDSALWPLHQTQTELLMAWRKQRDSGLSTEVMLFHSLLQSVNAIANALGTTG